MMFISTRQDTQDLLRRVRKIDFEASAKFMTVARPLWDALESRRRVFPEAMCQTRREAE
jgi:hypothetical protein